MRASTCQLYSGIVQTTEKIALNSKENSPLKVIHMDRVTGSTPDAIIINGMKKR
jgi:hypothetical protein